MVDGYENMGDPRLGKLAIIADHITDPDGVKFDYPLNDCKATTRHAKFGSQPDHPEEQWIIGAQDNDAVVAGLRNPKPFEGIILPGKLRAGLSDAFYRVVTQIPKFEDFGTKRFEGNGPDGDRKSLAFDSAENIHDFIHFVCGGPSAYRKKAGNNIGLKGHMSHVPVAAFDPIFWVHHCNVDRMVAIWEVLHNGDSDNWFDGTDERDKDSGNWAIEKNHPDLPSDPLRPFHKDEKGNYWTSNDIRETAPLGYNYPELEKWKYVDGEGKYDATAHKDALTLYLNNRYNSAASAAVKAILTPNPGELEAESDSSKPSLLQLQALTPHPVPEHDIIGAPDYVVNIVYNRFAFGGQPYTINIFVGRVPENVPYTFDDPEGSLVGQVYTFSSPADRLGTSEEIGCVNCRSQEAAEVMSSGTVVLTNALITRWKNQLEHTPRHAVLAGDEEQVPRVLKSMEPKDVVPFLQANLRWRVTSLGGIVAPERLESLRVSVAVGKADHFADQTKLSRFYNYQGANEVTRNRLQGAGPDDGLYPPN
ncbi:hypothetical protein QBC35DRAFT_498812 [Podospora australis]|uniref:tyrosinase n=1 Tax=Podospora australis TaxID=1536484 RepID=A0AAN7AHE2_9PEZI|nr:hypothetical protein QBC35DRAFT_498812 [Podospora australis]